VAERFPAVTDVCCFPVEDDLYGQNVGLAVVLADDRDETLRALHAWLGEHLATYQLPVRWYRVEAIPRTSRGKINRAGVAQTCAGLDPLDLRRVLGGGD
jgi:acyl-coenzyme A synthetase/AMP-(fatty) acid ligase